METTDAGAVAALLDQLGYAVPAARIEKHIGDPDATILVAEAEGRVIGMAAYNIRWHLHHDGLVASIDSFVVDQAFRSHGVGSVLLVSVCAQAERTGARIVDLHSDHSRVDARRFYERHGFEVTSNYFIKQL